MSNSAFKEKVKNKLRSQDYLRRRILRESPVERERRLALNALRVKRYRCKISGYETQLRKAALAHLRKRKVCDVGHLLDSSNKNAKVLPTTRVASVTTLTINNKDGSLHCTAFPEKLVTETSSVEKAKSKNSESTFAARIGRFFKTTAKKDIINCDPKSDMVRDLRKRQEIADYSAESLEKRRFYFPVIIGPERIPVQTPTKTYSRTRLNRPAPVMGSTAAPVERLNAISLETSQFIVPDVMVPVQRMVALETCNADIKPDVSSDALLTGFANPFLKNLRAQMFANGTVVKQEPPDARPDEDCSDAFLTNFCSPFLKNLEKQIGSNGIKQEPCDDVTTEEADSSYSSLVNQFLNSTCTDTVPQFVVVKQEPLDVGSMINNS